MDILADFPFLHWKYMILKSCKKLCRKNCRSHHLPCGHCKKTLTQFTDISSLRHLFCMYPVPWPFFVVLFLLCFEKEHSSSIYLFGLFCCFLFVCSFLIFFALYMYPWEHTGKISYAQQRKDLVHGMSKHTKVKCCTLYW